MRNLIIVLFFLTVSNSLHSQTKILKDNGSWFTFINKVTVSDKLNVVNITQQRRVGFLSKTQAFLFSPSINYIIRKNVNIGAGYLHYKAFPNGVSHASIHKNENRFFQQIMVSSNLEHVKLSQRFRFEERVIDLINTKVTPNVIKGNKYANRFRYRLQVIFNMFTLKSGKYIIGKLSNEIRIRFSNGITEPDFDQNNFAVFFGYKLLDNATIWIGYGRYYFRKIATKYVSNNILHVDLSYNFDLRKKK